MSRTTCRIGKLVQVEASLGKVRKYARCVAEDCRLPQRAGVVFMPVLNVGLPTGRSADVRGVRKPACGRVPRARIANAAEVQRVNLHEIVHLRQVRPISETVAQGPGMSAYWTLTPAHPKQSTHRSKREPWPSSLRRMSQRIRDHSVDRQTDGDEVDCE